MINKIVTDDDGNVLGTISYPKSDDIVEKNLQEPVTQLDRIEAQTAFITMMLGGD